MIYSNGSARAFMLPECMDGRAFVIKFVEPSQDPFFFWIQDGKWSQYGSRFLDQINSLLRSTAMVDKIPLISRGEKRNLATLLTPERVKLVLKEGDYESLYALLPKEVPHTPESLMGCLKSPYFFQALDSIGQAIVSGDVANLCIANSCDLGKVEDLLKALKGFFTKS